MRIVLTVLCLFGLAVGQAQSVRWQDVQESAISLPAGTDVSWPLSSYRTVEVSMDVVYSALRHAPAEGSSAARSNPLYVDLPTPDGGLMRFRVEDSPVMRPGLAARYPAIRSFRIEAGENGEWLGRLAVSPLGVHAVFRSPAGEVFIDPYASTQNRYHLVYYTKDVVADEHMQRALSCGYEGLPHEHDPLEGISPTDHHDHEQEGGRSGSAPVGLRVYDLALACTGEYGLAKGGTVEAVMATFNTTANRLNAIFEPEVSIRMMLIENNDQLIWLDPMTDPYVNANVGGELLGQNTQAIVQYGGIGFNQFDIGHVFTMGCTDVGGVAGGQVCTSGKARGVTCHYTNSIDAIVRRVMAHEIAHQFATSHSWSNCPGILGQLASGWAYEPGSGSTIMSYAGSCGSENVQFDSDIYYHAGSLFQFINFSRVEFGSTCADVIPTTNNEPEIDWPYENGFFIPIGTPFELKAQAADPDGDAITYCWEQYDLGPIANLGNPIGDGPAFRSYAPNANSNRYFPRINTIISNGSDVREVLPTYSRALTFRLTVRDNKMGGGGTVWETVSFRAAAEAGPFVVTSPNTGPTVWKGGEYKEVTWDVANTDQAPVNCRLVNIRLSTDGGLTYPITLLSNAPNSGSAFVTVPQLTSNQARIRVEGADNIFFDISNSNFSIQPATAPTYTLSYGPVFQELCLPAATQVSFNAGAILGYNSPVSLSLVGGLPAGAEAAFNTTTILPGEAATLSLDFTGLNYNGDLELLVQAVSGEDTTYRTVYFSLIDSDFSALQLVSPAMGENGINLTTNFSWAPSPNALTYDFQLATNPAYTPASIIESFSGLSATSASISSLLEENTLFYWRVRAANSCGEGAWLESSVFHTINAVCQEENSSDVPITIPGTGPPPTRESQLFVPFSGTISDVNIPLIDVRYAPIRNLRITLISPAGTEVVLFDQNCGGTNRVYIGFDDDAPSDILCAPDDGIVFKPFSPLSVLAGENTFGVWTLRVKVITTGFGSPGSIQNWGVEFCATAVPQSPVLITNDTLFVRPAGSNPVSRTLLAAEDTDNTPEDLRFTLVTPPAHGQLKFVNAPLQAGAHFRQSTIDAGNLIYEHDGSNTTADAFTFVVEDNTGGFIPVERFEIRVDEDAVVSTQSPEATATAFSLHPNPAADWFRLAVPAGLAEDTPVRVFNAQGQLILQQQLPRGGHEFVLNCRQWPAGLYFVRIANQTERLSVQH